MTELPRTPTIAQPGAWVQVRLVGRPDAVARVLAALRVVATVHSVSTPFPYGATGHVCMYALAARRTPLRGGDR